MKQVKFYNKKGNEVLHNEKHNSQSSYSGRPCRKQLRQQYLGEKAGALQPSRPCFYFQFSHLPLGVLPVYELHLPHQQDEVTLHRAKEEHPSTKKGIQGSNQQVPPSTTATTSPSHLLMADA